MVRVTFTKLSCALALLLATSTVCAKETTLDDLISVQSRVQNVLDQARKSVVVIECDGGTASGVIISPEGLVLTAAHVTNEPNKKVKVIFWDGKTVEGTSLGLDTVTDAAMVQLPKPAKAWPYATVQKDIRALNVGDWCFALGHAGGWDAARGSILRVGKLLRVSANMLQSDCVLMGGDSGGGLFDLNGNVIGINSQIWEGRDQNLHVSMAPFLRSWEALKKKEVIRVWQQGSGGWIGLSTQVQGENLAIHAIAPDSPAIKAGLKEGDHILSVNNEKTSTPAEFSSAIRGRVAGSLVSLRIQNVAGERTVEVKLGKRPED